MYFFFFFFFFKVLVVVFFYFFFQGLQQVCRFLGQRKHWYLAPGVVFMGMAFLSQVMVGAGCPDTGHPRVRVLPSSAMVCTGTCDFREGVSAKKRDRIKIE